MICLACNSKTSVIVTRLIQDGRIVRRRRCPSCGYVFYTAEEAVDYEDIKDQFLKEEKSIRNKAKKGISNG